MNIRKVAKIVICILGLLLFLDGLCLILANKIHLGSILPLLIGAILTLTIVFENQIQQILNKHPALKRIWCIGWRLFAIWLITLIMFFAWLGHSQSKTTTATSRKAIIVLGSGLVNGQASPTLAARLDKAAEIEKLNPNAIVIVSGGLGFKSKQTESKVMSDYLQEIHVTANKIFEENKSTSTELNLKNSQAILKQQGLDINSPITIVTSDFHTLRAAAIARKQGYQNFTTASAPTPLTTRYNAWLREYFAYISGWILNEYDVF